MICKTCGSNIPDGSAYCPVCGKGVETQQQPLYQGSEPVYGQSSYYDQQQATINPQQPYYSQPPKKSSGGKIALIIGLCIGAVVLVGCLGCACVACAAGIVGGLESVEDSGIDPSDLPNFFEDLPDEIFDNPYNNGLIDPDIDRGGEVIDGDFDTSEIEGGWITYSEDGEFRFSVDSEGNFESDDISEFLFGRSGAEYTLEKLVKIDSDQTRAYYSAKKGDFEDSFILFYNEHIIDLFIDSQGVWASFCRDIDKTDEAKNPELEELLTRTWVYDGSSDHVMVFGKGYVGKIVFGEDKSYDFDWRVIGDTVIINYWEDDAIDIMYADCNGKKLSLYYFYYSEDYGEDFEDMEWVSDDYKADK